jgi:hypothetical protein
MHAGIAGDTISGGGIHSARTVYDIKLVDTFHKEYALFLARMAF